MRMLLMGPPGAGKGTQAKIVAERLGIPAISTGDIFRANMAEETELGLEAKQYVDAGEYVPDDVTNRMVRARLAEPDAARGFLLDGYPRTVAQVETLDELLAETGKRLNAVVVLKADNDEIVQRLLKRAEVEGRSDDSEDVIRRRLEVYDDQTYPLLEVYNDHGVLVEVDGVGDVEKVSERVLAAIAPLETEQ
jgi:adenylate kinase